MLRILNEKDNLNNQYWARQKKPNPAPMSQVDRQKQALSPKSSSNDKGEYQYINRVNQVRAESIVIKNLLEVNLLKIAINAVTNEHSALLAAFDATANDSFITAYVHP